MNIKRCLVLALTIVMVITSLVTGCAKPAPTPAPAPTPTPVPAPEKIVLKLSHHSVGGGVLDKWLLQSFAMRANELGKGELEIQVYPGEQLNKGPDMYEAVSQGLVEMAWVPIPYESSTQRIPTVLELPFSQVDFPTTFKVWDEMLAAGLETYYTSRGVKPIYLAWADSNDFNTKVPVHTMEDLKGIKLRCAGGVTSESVGLLGGVPVSMPAMEVYTALQRGTVDGIAIQEHDMKVYRTYEFAKYILRADWVHTGGPVQVNLKVWNGLPKHIQDILLQAGRDTQDYYPSEYDKFRQEAAPFWVEQGVTVSDVTEEELARWKEKVMPLWDTWAKDRGPLEGGLGYKLLEILKKSAGVK